MFLPVSPVRAVVAAVDLAGVDVHPVLPILGERDA